MPPGKPLFRLAGSTLGLVGFGNIARQVAVRAGAFGMKVLYADPFVKEGQFSEPGTKVELNDLLQSSDFVSAHPPLTPETRKMINDDALSRMKPTAFLINCSRGPVVDTDALVRALDAKNDRGLRARHHRPRAAAQSPSPARPGKRHHQSARRLVQREGDGRACRPGAPNEVRRVLSGEWPVNVVNKAVKGKNRAGL